VNTPPRYVLGSDAPEIDRLDRQAAAISVPTRLLMQTAGIGPGMRVLDLGSGLGHVAELAAGLVGPEGSVLGVDQDERLLGVAASRSAANVAFVAGDARSFRDLDPFDALVMRLLLFHLPDAVDVMRHQIEALRPGGLVVAVDYDLGSIRCEPAVGLVDTARGWVEDAFRSAQANPRIGPALAGILREVGFAGVQTLGIQVYFQPDDPHGCAMLAAVVRTLAPQIIAQGIATEAELGLGSFEERLRQQVAAARAVVLVPTVVGAWGRRPA
jgi:SAM-dependent methyltransferase